MRVLPLLALCVLVLASASAQAPLVPCSLRVAYVEPLRRQPAASGTIFADELTAPPDRSRYLEYFDCNGSFVFDAQGGMAGGAMRAHFNKGQVEAGNLKVLFGRNPFGRGKQITDTFTDVWWRVYVKHERGWEGDPAKLARLTCLAGTDWSQGFIAHVWTGKNHALCIDPATGIRDSRKVTTKYNDFANLHWLGAHNTAMPMFTPAESGRWVCVESHVKLNTPGHADGVFQLWIDGKLEAEATGLDWQGNWTDYAADAFFLENYWNDGAVKDESRWFSDLVISTQPIGPVTAAAAPRFTVVATSQGAWQAEVSSSPDHDAVVWQSRVMDPSVTQTAISSSGGAFHGAPAGTHSLTPGATYWLRLREKLPDGSWSAWSPWHAPFKVAG